MVDLEAVAGSGGYCLEAASVGTLQSSPSVFFLRKPGLSPADDNILIRDKASSGSAPGALDVHR